MHRPFTQIGRYRQEVALSGSRFAFLWQVWLVFIVATADNSLPRSSHMPRVRPAHLFAERAEFISQVNPARFAYAE